MTIKKLKSEADGMLEKSVPLLMYASTFLLKSIRSIKISCNTIFLDRLGQKNNKQIRILFEKLNPIVLMRN